MCNKDDGSDVGGATQAATVTGAWCYNISARTGSPGVSIL